MSEENIIEGPPLIAFFQPQLSSYFYQLNISMWTRVSESYALPKAYIHSSLCVI